MLIRKAKKSDNFGDIGKLIYLTDPYIYPYWFNNNIEEAKSIFVKLLYRKCVFNYKNCIVAIKDNKIVGLILVVSKENKITDKIEDIKKVNFNYKYTIEKYVEKAYEYCNNDIVYILNVCVLPEYRNHKIGSRLMAYLMQNFQDKEFFLEVLANNIPAHKLYEKFGFKKVHEAKGFSGYKKPDVDIHIMIKNKWY